MRFFKPRNVAAMSLNQHRHQVAPDKRADVLERELNREIRNFVQDVSDFGEPLGGAEGRLQEIKEMRAAMDAERAKEQQEGGAA